MQLQLFWAQYRRVQSPIACTFGSVPCPLAMVIGSTVPSTSASSSSGRPAVISQVLASSGVSSSVVPSTTAAARGNAVVTAAAGPVTVVVPAGKVIPNTPKVVPCAAPPTTSVGYGAGLPEHNPNNPMVKQLASTRPRLYKATLATQSFRDKVLADHAAKAALVVNAKSGKDAPPPPPSMVAKKPHTEPRVSPQCGSCDLTKFQKVVDDAGLDVKLYCCGQGRPWKYYCCNGYWKKQVRDNDALQAVLYPEWMRIRNDWNSSEGLLPQDAPQWHDEDQPFTSAPPVPVANVDAREGVFASPQEAPAPPSPPRCRKLHVAITATLFLVRLKRNVLWRRQYLQVKEEAEERLGQLSSAGVGDENAEEKAKTLVAKLEDLKRLWDSAPLGNEHSKYRRIQQSAGKAPFIAFEGRSQRRLAAAAAPAATSKASSSSSKAPSAYIQRSGDWPCIVCGHMNRSWRDACNWSHCPSNNWVCPACGNLNFGDRRFCNRRHPPCSEARPWSLR